MEQTQYREAGVRYNEAKDLYVALGDDLRAFRSEMESMRGVVLYYGSSEELLAQSLSWKSRPHSAEISALIPFYSGKVRFYLMRTKEALEDLQNAKTQLSKLNYHYEAADCLLRTGRCWAVLGDFHRAIEVVNETIRLYEQLGASDERGFLNKSRYLKGANIWGDELSTTLQTALELSQELGKPVHTALVLDEFGEMYVHRKDWDSARLAYAELIKELDGFSDYTTSRIRTNTENNLLYIEALENNRLDSTIEFRPPQRF
jgi:tetratricopeptide (TPR) repeat protein